MAVRRRVAARTRERGAAAVEFALVLTVLFPVLLGIVDYGVWYTDSLSVRHGVNETARAAVVRNTVCPSNPGATGMTRIACMAKARVGAIGGPAAVTVKATDGWVRGKPLLVCVMVPENNLTGVTPFATRIIRAKAQLAIEDDTQPVDTTPYSDAAPSGANWTWCT